MENSTSNSIRHAERRELTPELRKARNTLIDMLVDSGFTVTIRHHTWMQVNVPGKTGVQLEIEPRGNNLDVVLLRDDMEGFFPLGGGMSYVSTVKLDDDNLDFALARVKAFFGIVDAEDSLNQGVHQRVLEEFAFRTLIANGGIK